jgi:hypothetical protein
MNNKCGRVERWKGGITRHPGVGRGWEAELRFGYRTRSDSFQKGSMSPVANRSLPPRVIPAEAGDGKPNSDALIGRGPIHFKRAL